MAFAKSGNLVANTAKDVTVDVVAFGSRAGVTVTNRSETGTIWVRTDGGNITGAAQDNCFPVMGTATFQVPKGNKTSTIKLWSTEALEYTVAGQ